MKKEVVKQINTTNIEILKNLSIEAGNTKKENIAKWIISVSPYWRSEGYAKIILELAKYDT